MELFENSSSNLYKHFVIRNVFSKDECLKIINSGHEFVPSTIYRHKDNSDIKQSNFQDKLNLNDRNSLSKTLFVNQETQWIYDRIAKLVIKANKAFYNFIIDGILQMEVLKYEQNGFFGPHSDLGNQEVSGRKLTIVAMLSDSSEYEGGNLKFLFEKEQPQLLQGSVVIFPSYAFHVVEPVTNGNRYTLVTWVEGPHFR
jgi:hypothetical protein